MTTVKQTLDRIGIDASEIVGPHGDAWGASMGALFDIAHALEHYGREGVPSHWDYCGSPFCTGLLPSSDARKTGEDQTARGIAAYIARHPEREREIVRAGNVLDRYIGILDRAGRSY